jgi:hypothetical protein
LFLFTPLAVSFLGTGTGVAPETSLHTAPVREEVILISPSFAGDFPCESSSIADQALGAHEEEARQTAEREADLPAIFHKNW